MPQAARAHRWVRGLWLLALLAVVLAQTLALVHRVVHPGGSARHEVHQAHLAQPACDQHGDHDHPPGHDHADDHDHAHDHTQHAHGSWLASLFAGHHEAESACQLFDALGAGDSVWSSVAALGVVAVPRYWLTFYAGQALARWAALYQARGPPVSR